MYHHYGLKNDLISSRRTLDSKPLPFLYVHFVEESVWCHSSIVEKDIRDRAWNNGSFRHISRVVVVYVKYKSKRDEMSGVFFTGEECI